MSENSVAFDTSDSEAVEKRNRELESIRDRERKDLLTVLETAEGRRVLWKILTFTRPMGMSYTPGGVVEDMFFKEGRKSVGHWLISEMEDADPKAYHDLQGNFINE